MPSLGERSILAVFIFYAKDFARANPLLSFFLLSYTPFFSFQETAVSTAHFAQANTIEYQMAMEWRLLQIRSEVLWAELYKVS